MSCSKSPSVFQEAINHSRAPQHLLLRMIDELNRSSYEGKTFEHVLTSVTQRTDGLQGFGPLTFYDIASGISRWNAIDIQRVYIMGPGPKNAAKLLNLRLKTFRVESRTFKYAECKDVVDALQKRNVVVPDNILKNGDALETFLCKWQKTVR